jgi:hypothetical protein
MAMKFGVRALHAIEQDWRVGRSVRSPGESWATSRQGACHRFHDRAGSPACSRCKRGNQNQEALGRSRGGFSTKIHLRANAKGNPLTFDVTGGEAHEVKGYDALMELHHERIRALPGVIAWHAALTPPSHSQRTVLTLASDCAVIVSRGW